MTRPAGSWSGTDGGPGISLVTDTLTPDQIHSARRPLASAAVRAGATADELRQALDICGLLPDKPHQPEGDA